MIYDEQRLLDLKKSVSARMSEERFLHTLGVLETALHLAEFCMPASKFEIAVSALLHDVTKELSLEEQKALIKSSDYRISREDFLAPETIHALTAPIAIERDFPEFMTEKIINAVKHHTVGSPDMSLFDEIIFLSDFIEPGRKYESCLSLRKEVYEGLCDESKEKNIFLIHNAVIKAIDFTIINLIKNKRFISPKTVLTRNALLDKINNTVKN